MIRYSLRFDQISLELLSTYVPEPEFFDNSVKQHKISTSSPSHTFQSLKKRNRLSNGFSSTWNSSNSEFHTSRNDVRMCPASLYGAWVESDSEESDVDHAKSDTLRLQSDTTTVLVQKLSAASNCGDDNYRCNKLGMASLRLTLNDSSDLGPLSASGHNLSNRLRQLLPPPRPRDLPPSVTGAPSVEYPFMRMKSYN